MKEKFRKILFIFFFVVFIISITYIIFYLYSLYKDENDIKKIQAVMNSNGKINNFDTTQNYEEKNKIENVNFVESNKEIDDTEISNFKMVQAQNPNIVAWLKIENTNINYPVLQSNDNNYYINRNYKDEYSKNGSIFLDYRFDFSKKSSNFLIYGHNNRNGLMFEELLEYKNYQFFENHSKIKLITEESNEVFEIFAVFESKVYLKTDKNVFRYYNYVNFENEEEFLYYINNCKEKSLYNVEINPKYGDEILTLSTCDFSRGEGRFVIVAVKKN